MITKIGIVAGEIWHYLDKHSDVMLSDLLSDLPRKKELLLMSIGWLAREGHVVLEEIDSDFKVFLRQQA